MTSPLPTTTLSISNTEYQQRLDRLRHYLHTQKLSGVVLFDRDYILYYTGFAFIPTERPIAFGMNTHGETGMFVPRLELEHAKSKAVIQRVEHYLEYPFTPHPMNLFRKMLLDMGTANGAFGADHDGYPWIFGYRGPSLTELTGHTPHPVNAFIEDQMMIKSPAEIALIKESIQWANLAHTLLQRYTRPGLTETEVAQRASHEATLAMLDAIGPLYRAQSYFTHGARAGYRGQIGRNAAIPHALAANITFQPGDILVTGASAAMWGYHSELERTMIICPATDPQKRLFDHMLALQELAIRTLQPGLPCAEVDRAVRAYYDQHDLMPHWKHHVGHAIGLRYHEAPFLDLGDPTFIQPGMVFTVEPGLYDKTLGGYRHSDTVLITENGVEVLTYYPRDLDSLTIPA
ncbi:MAG TPA: Xaa-Pro peptidase family protein [Anaerolineales bacterium]|nr:Xaa-Pro peptidase family protein [Anaerolineales bacterium]